MKGVREAQKQATRERVLSSARALFVDVGYEGATVRMIARHAGVATGSVFTTFPSKGAILQAVIEERVAGLCAELDALIPTLQGSAIDQLRAVMAAKCAFEMRRPELFTAFLAVSYDWAFASTLGGPICPPRALSILSEIVHRGVERGEIKAETDVDLFVDLLMAAYGSNYRRVAREGLSIDALCKLMDRQIVTLFDGVRTRPN